MHDPTCNQIHSAIEVISQNQLGDLDLSSPPAVYAPQWYDDIFIFQGNPRSMDWDVDDQSEYLYAIIDNYAGTSGPDSAYIFRSTNKGVTWTQWYLLTNMDGQLENAKIRVARDGAGNTWICAAAIWAETSGDRILWLRRIDATQTTFLWEELSGIDVDIFDMDADVGDGAWLYITYVPDGTDDIYAARNDISGGGWTSVVSLYSNAQTNPEPVIAAGDNGVVSVGFIDGRLQANEELRVKRSTNYGANWLGSEQVGDNTGLYDLSDIDIAHARNNSAWFFASYYVVSADNIGVYVSNDAGVNWSYEGLVSGSGDNFFTSARASKTSGSVTVAYYEANNDSVMFTWSSSSNPTAFTSAVNISDFRATGTVPPVAGWIHRFGAGYSAIMYATWGPDSVMFDWFSNSVGIEEQPVINVEKTTLMQVTTRENNFTVSYSVINPGNVRISVYDMTGRQITQLVNQYQNTGFYNVNYTPETPGVYYISLISADGQQTVKSTILQ
ncbi:MAG: hypothetical protein APR63_01795 [Desulfuromonas sp. SDB]|nr:MAG: hypothetical protein APR63_01795 [Desulfuromonas sp. SDB]